MLPTSMEDACYGKKVNHRFFFWASSLEGLYTSYKKMGLEEQKKGYPTKKSHVLRMPKRKNSATQKIEKFLRFREKEPHPSETVWV